jgi:hypothetical protein
MTKQRVRVAVAVFCVVIAITGAFCLAKFRFAPVEYIGRVDVVAQPPVDRHTDHSKSKFPLIDQSPNTVGAVLTSERVLQAAARTLTLFNISLDPEKLLSAVKVEPIIPGSEILKIEMSSHNRVEVGEAVEAVAKEGQRVYLEAVNDPGARQSDEDALKLKIIGPVRVSPAPFQPLAIAVISVGILATIVVLLIAVVVGRVARGGRRAGESIPLRRAAIAVLVVVFATLLAFCARALKPHELFCGRVKLIRHSSPQAGRWPDAADRLERWSRTALDKSLATEVAGNLKLFNITQTAEGVLHTAVAKVVPGSEIMMVEFTASASDEAEATADALALEIRKDYFKSNNPPGTPLASATASRLNVLEEAHVYPIDLHIRYGIAASFVFLLGALGGILGRRRTGEPE